MRVLLACLLLQGCINTEVSFVDDELPCTVTDVKIGLPRGIWNLYQSQKVNCNVEDEADDKPG